MNLKKILIIGGGISGLSVAYFLQKLAASTSHTFHVQVVERTTRFGGKIHTYHRDNYVIEKGADSFLARKPIIVELSKELGIFNQLVAVNPNAQKTYIVRNHQLHPIPQGTYLGIPTQVKTFLTTPLISRKGKLRAICDLVLPHHASHQDQSVGELLRKRFGDELVDYMIEPILAGIYAGHVEQLSVQATFPFLLASVEQHGSIIRGLSEYQTKLRNQPQLLPNHFQHSLFLSYQNGLQTLVQAFMSHLSQVKFLHEREVIRLNRNSQHLDIFFREGPPEQADVVISAVSPHQISPVIPESRAQRLLSQIPSASVAHIVFVYEGSNLQTRLQGSGFVVPRLEPLTITACTWTSQKWKHTAPPNSFVLRCYVGRYGDEKWMEYSDQELIVLAMKDLATLLHIHEQPISAEVTRMPQAMPQYLVGHLHRLAHMETILDEEYPGLFLTGAGFRGVGLPDCILQAKQTAQLAFNYLVKESIRRD